MRILSFGEILWDMIRGTAHIGGAPFNLSAHLTKLGAESLLISAVGNDALGRRALDSCRSLGIDTRMVKVSAGLPTGTVDVTVGDHGSPQYTIHENTAWDRIELDPGDIRSLAGSPVDAFCFGTLARRAPENRETLSRVLAGIHPPHIFYDVNLRQQYYTKDLIEYSLKQCSIAKLNEDESIEIFRMFFNGAMDTRGIAATLCAEFNIATVVITRGPMGAAVFRNGRFDEIPGIKVKVADTVGAGDAFSAGFLYAFLSGSDTVTSARFAARLGAYVASCPGAVPEYTDTLRMELDELLRDK